MRVRECKNCATKDSEIQFLRSMLINGQDTQKGLLEKLVGKEERVEIVQPQSPYTIPITPSPIQQPWTITAQPNTAPSVSADINNWMRDYYAPPQLQNKGESKTEQQATELDHLNKILGH